MAFVTGFTLIYGLLILGAIGLGLYISILLIKALQIYIRKNS